MFFFFFWTNKSKTIICLNLIEESNILHQGNILKFYTKRKLLYAVLMMFT